MMTWDQLGMQIIGTLIGGAGVYAAIRADLSQLNARVKSAEENTKDQRERLDRLIESLMNSSMRERK